MRFLLISALISLLYVNDATCFIFHQVKHVHLSRLRRAGEVETTLKSGPAKIARIEADRDGELPPLPIGDDDDDDDDVDVDDFVLQKSKIGKIDKNGQILVPLDENRNVVKEFEFLLRPIIVTINNPGGSDQEISTNYDDIEEEEEKKEDVEQLPPVGKDYTDSGEVDEDVTVTDTEADVGGVKLTDESPIESIYPNRNELGDPIPLVFETEKQKETQTGDVVEVEIEKKSEEKKEEEEKEEKKEEGEIDEAEIQNIADELGKDVLEKIMQKANEFDWDEKKENQLSTSSSQQEDVQASSANSDKVEVEKSSDILEGVVLPSPNENDDKEEQSAWVEKSRIDEEKPSKIPNVIVRGGRIGSEVKPDGAATIQNSLIFVTISILLLQLL